MDLFINTCFGEGVTKMKNFDEVGKFGNFLKTTIRHSLYTPKGFVLFLILTESKT